jgi:hypothetical protein
MVSEQSSRAATGLRGSNSWWLLALIFILGGTMTNEAVPLLLGTGAAARVDWSFPYVTMKFVLLPAVSLLLLGALVVGAFRHSHVTWHARVAALVALAYMVILALWPVPWFS